MPRARELRPYLPSFTPASAAQEQALIAKKPVPGVKFVPGTEAAPVRACVLRGGQPGPAPRPQLRGRTPRRRSSRLAARANRPTAQLEWTMLIDAPDEYTVAGARRPCPYAGRA